MPRDWEGRQPSSLHVMHTFITASTLKITGRLETKSHTKLRFCRTGQEEVRYKIQVLHNKTEGSFIQTQVLRNKTEGSFIQTQVFLRNKTEGSFIQTRVLHNKTLGSFIQT